MAGVLCDDGIDALNALLAASMVANAYKVRLFTNVHTPALSDTLGTYTVPTFGGYVEQALSGISGDVVSGNIDVITFNGVTFTATGSGLPETVQGYFITDGTDLIGAELFPVPITLSVAGQGINVVPSISYQDRSVA